MPEAIPRPATRESTVANLVSIEQHLDESAIAARILGATEQPDRGRFEPRITQITRIPSRIVYPCSSVSSVVPFPNRDGFGLPTFAEFDEEEIVPDLHFVQRRGIGITKFLNLPDLKVVGMPGAVGIIVKREQIGDPRHGWKRMFVIDRIGIIAC